MNMKLILIQGNRPGAGKDTVAQMCIEELCKQKGIPRIAHAKVSWPLKALVHDLFDVAVDNMQEPIVENKETYRADYIAISESMKKVRGEFFWASLFIEQHKNRTGQFKYKSDNPEYLIVSDSGFYAEASLLAQHFGIGNTMMIRVIRPSENQIPDSRKLFSVGQLGVFEVDIHNMGTLADLQDRVGSVIRML